MTSRSTKKPIIWDFYTVLDGMSENDISYMIRGCVFDVYNILGPGLLESVYEKALEVELKEKWLNVKTQVPIPMTYKNIKIEAWFRIDILVNDLVVAEVKSVENLADVHYKQLLTYIKLTNKKLWLLVNFNVANIADNIKRLVNNL